MKTSSLLLYCTLTSMLYFACGTGSSGDKKDGNIEYADDSFPVPDPTDTINIKPENYSRYIILSKTEVGYVKEVPREQGKFRGTEEGSFEVVNFGIHRVDDWWIIKTPEAVDFFTYFDLVSWYTLYNDDYSPYHVIGYAESSISPSDNYLFILDPKNDYEDMLIGSFKSGLKFNVYLPAAFEGSKALILNDNLKFDYTNLAESLEVNHCPLSDISEMDFEYFEVRIYQ